MVQTIMEMPGFRSQTTLTMTQTLFLSNPVLPRNGQLGRGGGINGNLWQGQDREGQENQAITMKLLLQNTGPTVPKPECSNYYIVS